MVRVSIGHDRMSEVTRAVIAVSRLLVDVFIGLIVLVIERISEHSDDVPGQMILDFAVSWHRLGNPGRRVQVPVVPPSMAAQDASESLDGADQVNSLHGTTNSSTFRMPGSSPLVRSRYRSMR
jgi:hypothetical protein